MKRNPLGRSGETVPQICIGTMTWGSKNSEDEAHAQIDMALDHGAEFLDAAELYPVPAGPKWQGRTEEIIGSWCARTGRRNALFIASKIAGGEDWIRNGKPICGPMVKPALDGTLKRLGIDHVDLYQLHWPSRGHYHFRRQWAYDPTGQDRTAERQRLSDLLGALGREVEAGRIRHVGLSNDTAWGTLQTLELAEAAGLPRPVSVQNEYSLLYRMHDTDMAEVSHHEDIGLLAYTPLAGGILSGKYSGMAIPDNSRAVQMPAKNRPAIGGRLTDRAVAAADAYASLARDHGLDPAQMALAFLLTRPFMTSVIIGATTLDQLKTNLGAANVELTDDVLDGIDRIHRSMPQTF